MWYTAIDGTMVAHAVIVTIKLPIVSANSSTSPVLSACWALGQPIVKIYMYSIYIKKRLINTVNERTTLYNCSRLTKSA